jgi:hypothetical protein
MATVESNAKNEHARALKAEWLSRLTELITLVEQWAKESDWSTRWIDKRMDDSEIGDYIAPALILQKETARIMLEPITRQGVGADGVVDLYLMPAYDDIASILFCNGDWQLYYSFSRTLTPQTEQAGEPLSRELMDRILEEMVRNAK